MVLAFSACAACASCAAQDTACSTAVGQFSTIVQPGHVRDTCRRLCREVRQQLVREKDLARGVFKVDAPPRIQRQEVAWRAWQEPYLVL